MTPTLRALGQPSPLAIGTHLASYLPDAIPFDSVAAGQPEIPSVATASGSIEPHAMAAVADLFDVEGLSPRLRMIARMIRPLCVGALMAIPTLGPATVGVVAVVAPDRAMAMAAASTQFLAGIPGDIVALIGFLAGGYGLAKTIEKRLGKAS